MTNLYCFLVAHLPSRFALELIIFVCPHWHRIRSGVRKTACLTKHYDFVII